MLEIETRASDSINMGVLLKDEEISVKTKTKNHIKKHEIKKKSNAKKLGKRQKAVKLEIHTCNTSNRSEVPW